MAKKTGHLTEFHINATKVANVRNIKPPGKSRDKVDMTDLDSELEEFVDEDIIKMGTVEISVFSHPGSTNDNLADDVFDDEDWANREVTFKIRYPKFTPVVVDTFDGFIENIEPETIEMKNAIARKLTIQPTTVITRTTEA